MRLSVWAAIACLVLAACGPAQQKPVTAAAELADIPIGVAGPMSGDLAAFGEQIKEGAQLAVEDINEAGGLLGKPLRLLVSDDRCDPKRARSVAADMADQGVPFVVGHFCSGSSIPASEVYRGEGVIQISPSSTNPALTDDADARGWRHVFRVCGRDDWQGTLAAEELARAHPGARIAVVRDDSSYGRAVTRTLLPALRSKGVETVAIEISANRDSYAAEVDRIVSADVDAVYYAGYHTEAAVLLKNARAAGLGVPFYGPDAFSTSELWALAGDAAEGTAITSLGVPRGEPSVDALIARLARRGHDAEIYTILSYVAVQVYAEAVRRAGSFDESTAAEELRKGSYDSVIGTVTFDRKGDILDPPWAWYRFTNGDIERL